MALLFKSFHDNVAQWQVELRRHIPDLDIRLWPYEGDPAEIDVAFMFQPPQGELRRYPNLKALINLSVGVDVLLADPDLPPGLPLARTVDPGTVELIATYFVYGAIHFHRNFDQYRRDQLQARWQFIRGQQNATRKVGVMGLGAIGTTCAQRLKLMGFDVRGWSRGPRALEGIACFAGEAGLTPFLAETEILCCIVPQTPETTGMVNADFLARMPERSYLINAARGPVIVEADLLAALDSGRLAGAMLDVFPVEPLPTPSPFWSHPRVVVTPHAAGNTNPVTAAPQVAENIRRALAGLPLLNQVDRERGY